MREYLRKNIILIAFILVGIIACLCLLICRIEVEKDMKSYDIVADYSSFREMSEQSEMGIQEWLEHLAQNGVNKIVLYESNLTELDEQDKDISVKTKGEIEKKINWKHKYPEKVCELIGASKNNDDILLSISDKEKHEWIEAALKNRVNNIRLTSVSEKDMYYIWICGDNEKINETKCKWIPLGLWPEQVKDIEAAGCQVIPVTTTIKGHNGSRFSNSVLKSFKKYDSPYYFTSGNEVLGFDQVESGKKDLADYLKATNASYVLMEDVSERGNVTRDNEETFLKEINYNCVRAYFEWSFVQCRYKYYNYDGPQEIANSLCRAVIDRGCRLLYLNPILAEQVEANESPAYVTDSEEYTRLISRIHARMSSCGYSYQTVRASKTLEANDIIRIIMGFGCVAAAVLLLDLFCVLSRRQRLILLIIFDILVIAVFMLAPETGTLILSISGGILMPCIASVGFVRYMRYTKECSLNETGSGSVILQSFIGTLVLATISFVGAMYTSAALSETSFMLEISSYRGVKVMQLVPLMAFILSYVQVYVLERKIFGWDIPRISSTETGCLQSMRREKWSNRKSVLGSEHKSKRPVLYIALALIVIIIVVYYIRRTGNVAVDSATQINQFEMTTRSFLEDKLLARPRFKEMIIGYPCLLLMIWSFKRDLPVAKILFGLFAVIGLTSIVNTFLHIRALLMISFVRLLLGLSLGLTIGLCALGFAEFAYKLIKKSRQTPSNDVPNKQ